MSTINRKSTSRAYHSGWINIKQSGGDYRCVFAKLVKKELLLFANEEASRGPNAHVDDYVWLGNVHDVSLRPMIKRLGRPISPPMVVISFRQQQGSKNAKIKTENEDSLKKWHRCLHAVAMLQLPSDVMDLLPGQVQEFRDIIDDVQKLPKSRNISQIPTRSIDTDYPIKSEHLIPEPHSTGGEKVEDPPQNESVYVTMKAVNVGRKTSLPASSRATKTGNEVTRRISVIPKVKPRGCHTAATPRGGPTAADRFTSHEVPTNVRENRISLDQSFHIRPDKSYMEYPPTPDPTLSTSPPIPSRDSFSSSIDSEEPPYPLALENSEPFLEPRSPSFPDDETFRDPLPEPVSSPSSDIDRFPPPSSSQITPGWASSEPNGDTLGTDFQPVSIPQSDKSPFPISVDANIELNHELRGPSSIGTRRLPATPPTSSLNNIIQPPIPQRRYKEEPTPPQNYEAAASRSTSFKWLINRPIGRRQAEVILNENSEYGNMLLRRRKKPENDPWSFAVSLRCGNSFKHYLVRDEPIPGSIRYHVHLEHDSHLPITSLEGIMAYFSAKSTGELQPLNYVNNAEEETYDEYLPGPPTRNMRSPHESHPPRDLYPPQGDDTYADNFDNMETRPE